MIFKTERLILRPWKESDAECLYHFAKNPNIGPIAGWPPHQSIEDSLNIIKTVFAKKETYAITLDDVPIGCVGLLIHPDGNHYWGDGSAELGYWVAEKYWGRGLAVEAAKPILNHAFDDLDIHCIYASYRIENTQSKRVLEKLGFEYYIELENVNYQGEAFREIAVKKEK
ncbi:GNAT family N-acetyltransferase [Methanobrevibacter sp.]|uniref:GNAT family N-acetyltransferase n=1 Tax=Methanobrevibacter sp. TaxID=66852 RepID=UPI0026DFB668|nr:GNAT family N-acetyltransferase [Methanobrevibacter sp.]MDO5860007.1 GNAT family N-acetyltransferase [Methanobrevibacter sp.]